MAPGAAPADPAAGWRAGGRGGEEAGGIPPGPAGGTRPLGRRSGGRVHVGARPPVGPGDGRGDPGSGYLRLGGPLGLVAHFGLPQVEVLELPVECQLWEDE